MMKKLLKWVGGLVLTAAMVACGGGGGSAGDTPGGGGGGTTGPTLVVTIVNQAGASVNSISVGGGFVARATVRDAAGAVVPNKTVTFNLNGASIAVLATTTALTNASGVAQVAISPASIDSAGAATLSASADVAGTAATGSVDFSVDALSLTLSPITAGLTNLLSGENTSLSTTANVGGVPSTGVPVNVTYSASCGRINGSLLSGGVSVTTNGSGVAEATYSSVKPDGSLCSGPVTISASSVGAASQSIVLTVAAPTASAITFVSAQPAQIFVAGFGLPGQAIVRFRVLTSAGNGLANVSVTFSIEPNPFGVGIGSSGSFTPVTATTDADGVASVSVFSGTEPGPVKLRAALSSNSAIFADSQNLTVASGPPSQGSMSLSVATFNIEGWDLDGVSTVLTARVADRQGNPVPNGTVINFTTEGGQVASSCATATVGDTSSCSVNFVSQNNRPADGRVSVLAYTEGTKDYIDTDSNNEFNAGDTLIQLGDAYRDDDENGEFNSSLDGFRISRNVSGGTCPNQGAPFPSISGSCDNLLATTVRQQTTILFSSSTPVLNASMVSVDTNGDPVSMVFTLGSAAHPLLPLPAGTVIEATAVDQTSGNGVTCSVTFGPSNTPIPNISPGTNPASSLATIHEVSLKDCRAGDRIAIDVTVPSGLKTTLFIDL